MLKKLLWVLAMLMANAAHAAIDANKADEAALESIKGIGPAVSTRILDERKKAPFKHWGDFVSRVKGIGERNAKRFSRDGLTVNGTVYTPAQHPTKTHHNKGKPAKQDDKY